MGFEAAFEPFDHTKRDFWITGGELEKFSSMIDRRTYATLEDAKAANGTGVYHVTIQTEGYWVNESWVPANKPKDKNEK